MKKRVARLLGQLAAGAWYKQTRAEQTSYRNTINLFFGALLGANLGTLNQLGLEDYITLVAVLMGSVMALQLVSAARSRRYAAVTISIYAGALLYTHLGSGIRPEGLAVAAFEKLTATLAVWLVAVAVIELTPTLEDDGEH